MGWWDWLSDISDKFTSTRTKGLESEISPPTPFYRKIWDVAKMVPIYTGGYLIGGTPLMISAALGGTAYVIGNAIETVRKDVYWRWRDAFKDFVRGSWFGGGTFGLFEAFAQYPAASTADMWKRTGVYVGTVAGAGIPIYRMSVFAHEENRLGDLLRPKRIGSLFRDAWHYDIKKNWAKMALRSALIITLPIHLILNYVPGGSVVKVAAQKGLTVINRLIQGGKASIHKYAKKPEYEKKPNILPLKTSKLEKKLNYDPQPDYSFGKVV